MYDDGLHSLFSPISDYSLHDHNAKFLSSLRRSISITHAFQLPWRGRLDWIWVNLPICDLAGAGAVYTFENAKQMCVRRSRLAYIQTESEKQNARFDFNVGTQQSGMYVYMRWADGCGLHVSSVLAHFCRQYYICFGLWWEMEFQESFCSFYCGCPGNSTKWATFIAMGYVIYI